MTTHEVLVAARNRLTRIGWAQNMVTADEKPTCAAGHIYMVGGSGETYRAATFALAEAIGIEPPWEMSAVWVGQWNDALRRTEEEVLAAFDKAIAATAPEPSTDLVTDAPPLIEVLV